MDGSPGSPALAVVGALGLLGCALFAPLNVLGATLWLLPLAAIHLWPREAHLGVSVMLILVLGMLVDLWLGRTVGAMASVGLIWFALVRPDLRDEDAGEAQMWFTFVVGIALVTAATLVAYASRSTSGLLPLVYDALAAVLLFPVVFRVIRFFRLLTRDTGEEAFP